MVRGAIPKSGSAQRGGFLEGGKILRKYSGVKDDGIFGRILRPGNRASKRLLVLILLNVAYSVTELLIGLFTRRVGEHLVYAL